MSIVTQSIAHDPRFPESDGVPLDSAWHREEIDFLLNLIRYHFRQRDDFYVAGNMFIYYDANDPRKAVGPDVFYVKGVNRFPRRRIWAVWRENNRYPDTIFELMSPRTKNKDRKTNKAIYEQVFRTPEYFLYDPETEVLDGWRLIEGQYEAIVANDDGWLWSEELRLWVGTWHGVLGTEGEEGLWVRLYHPDGALVLSHAEEEHERAEEERRRAEQKHKQAQLEAERERQRAEAAEAELARLRTLLEQQDRSEES